MASGGRELIGLPKMVNVATSLHGVVANLKESASIIGCTKTGDVAGSLLQATGAVSVEVSEAAVVLTGSRNSVKLENVTAMAWTP